jgi:non-specific serine/threonine protein kinase
MKKDVLKDLPEKNVITITSEMEPEQLAVYKEYNQYYKNQVLDKINDGGINKSTFDILTALLKLRQISLFPQLADNKLKKIKSAKFELFKDLINDIIKENYKVAIFSQFVQVLKIIEDYFKKEKLEYSYLDGSCASQNRKKSIQQFQDNENIKLFLLSIKAGGVGINLTAADYVIIFDPWWNPAVEEQAIDRVHRIGRKNKVIAYKMILKNSIEEKILELQKTKKHLSDKIITNEKSFFKSLKKQDVINLFE